MRMPVSSTFPKSLLTKVPKVFISGLKTMYCLINGGTLSPYSAVNLPKVRKPFLKLVEKSLFGMVEELKENYSMLIILEL